MIDSRGSRLAISVIVVFGMALLCAALVMLSQHPGLAAPPSPSDRQAVLDGTLQGCNDKMPKVIRQRVGSTVVTRFCSCYASEIANNVTKEQTDALAAGPHPPIVAAIPRYEETIRKAWRTCEKQYLSNAH
jgi:hypothetical protein